MYHVRRTRPCRSTSDHCSLRSESIFGELTRRKRRARLSLFGGVQTWQNWHFPLLIARVRRGSPPKTFPTSSASSKTQSAPAKSESSISASSSGGAGWCGRTSSCGSWWHAGGDEPEWGVSESSFFAWRRLESRVLLVAKTYVALAADGLVAVVLGGEGLQGRLDDTTTEAEDQVEGGLLWRLSVLLSFDPHFAICRLV